MEAPFYTPKSMWKVYRDEFPLESPHNAFGKLCKVALHIQRQPKSDWEVRDVHSEEFAMFYIASFAPFLAGYEPCSFSLQGMHDDVEGYTSRDVEHLTELFHWVGDLATGLHNDLSEQAVACFTDEDLPDWWLRSSMKAMYTAAFNLSSEISTMIFDISCLDEEEVFGDFPNGVPRSVREMATEEEAFARADLGGDTEPDDSMETNLTEEDPTLDMINMEEVAEDPLVVRAAAARKRKARQVENPAPGTSMQS